MSRTTRKEIRELYDKLKSNPCVDCGGKFHACAMQFDHRPNEEKFGCVSQMLHRDKEVILAEIAKCDLVCANCHAVRTFNSKVLRDVKSASAKKMWERRKLRA